MHPSSRPEPGSPLLRKVIHAICTIAAATSLCAFAGETTNRLGITMVDIPAGSFAMGSCVKGKIAGHLGGKLAALLGESSCANPDPDAGPSETPQHQVSVKAFQMGKTEVTLGQFKQYITAANRSDLVGDDFKKNNSNGDNAPVVQVSWTDAQGFIDWLNTSDGGGYRLPSEAEWEYACRAGGKSTYCGSDNIESVAWYHDNSDNRAHVVGDKQANAFGLYDMSGNVREHVQDCWHDSYVGAPTDGSVWTESCTGSDRVLRGGSWYNYTKDARAADRYNNSPGNRFLNSGLRLARTR